MRLGALSVGWWSYLLAPSALAATPEAHPEGDAHAEARPLPRSDVVPPKLKHFVEAAYPTEAARQGIEAEVILQIAIDAEGHVTSVEVRDSKGAEFDAAAVAAAQQFTFEPAEKRGIPVAARILYRYTFVLKEKPNPETAPELARPRPGELRGKVLAGTPPSPLVGIVVKLIVDGAAPLTATTAPDGSWSFPDLAPGDYAIEVAAPGYRSVLQREHVDAGLVTAVTYGLETSDDLPVEVTVRGTAMHREVTRYELSRTELIRVPGTMGDAIHAVEAMPSVARPPAFSGALIVRGSAPQDTQVFIEGTYVPRVFHYASLSSVIPSEMIERIEFYPSNFSSRYGRSMGGIIDVGMRETNPDGKFHGSAQADFINARANVEGTLPFTQKWRYMAGFRTTYVDRWLVPVLRASGSAVEGMPRYYDYQLYLERALPNGGLYRVGVFGAHDRFVPIEKNPKDWWAPSEGFGYLQSQLRWPISEHVQLKASWSMGRTVSNEPGDDGRTSKTTFTLGTLRSELSVKTGGFGIARLGTDILYAPFKLHTFTDQKSTGGSLASGQGESLQLALYDLHGTLLRPAGYVEYEWAPSPRLNVTAGTRIDYAKDTSRTDVAPRLAARYVVIPGAISTVVKGGVGLFYQPPLPAQTLPELGTPNLTSSRAVHSMVGFEQSLTKQVSVSVEGFEKELRALVSTRMDGSGSLVTDNAGKGRVFGADVLLRYRADERFFGWVSYTLSRSTRKLEPDEPSRLFLYDQPHIVNVLASYRLGRGWELGGRFRYMSGFLYRACSGGLFDNAVGRYQCYGPFEQKRFAPFHQLDLRIEKTWIFASSKISAYMDLINAYFHTSPDFAVPKYDYSAVKGLSLSLPLLPSLGIRGEL
jgi:TonB family protein